MSSISASPSPTFDAIIRGKTEEGRGDNTIYNLAGQRLQKAQRGVNIINGKKVVVK